MSKVENNYRTPKDVLKKRQWSKYISKGISLSLMHFNQTSLLYKSYKNTSYCNEVLSTNEVGRIKSSYCKNRWCLTCNRIKTARSINNYYPQLQNLTNPQFVTLTLPTCTAEQLPQRIKDLEQTWRNLYVQSFKAKYKKSYSPLKGIRKSEITIRPNGQYHYHYHLILDNLPQAEWLVNQWLKANPTANIQAQNITPCTENSFKELFKYAFKAEVKTNNKTNAKRYDIVFTALRGKRTYHAFGGIRKIDEDFNDEDLTNGTILEDLPNHTFHWVMTDWYDQSTGDALVNLAIPQKVKDLTNYPQSN